MRPIARSLVAGIVAGMLLMAVSSRNAWRTWGMGRHCSRVILTGAGQPTFTVGADISDDLSAGPEVARVVNHALLKNDAYSKPAAVNGDCIGGGIELLLSTDIRAAVPEARFGLPEVGDLSVRRPGTAPIRSRIAAHCAYGDCLRPKLRWRGWRRGVLPRALWPSASSAPR